ncbi:MAG: hypothetical protein AB7F43_09615 [Bacteriovoracia bacterium]
MLKRLVFLTFLASCFLGCEDPIINNFQYSIPANLETLSVTAVFSDALDIDAGGTFPVLSFGQIEVYQKTSSNPFRVGFRLNLDVMNQLDQFIYKATTTMPSGMPFPNPIRNRALAEIEFAQSISKDIEPLLYIDLADNGRQWLGAAALFPFIDEGFPEGVTVSQGFLEDANKIPRAIVSVFGPKLQDGKVVNPGGVAVFVNIVSLVGMVRSTGKIKQMQFGFSSPIEIQQ